MALLYMVLAGVREERLEGRDPTSIRIVRHPEQARRSAIVPADVYLHLETVEAKRSVVRVLLWSAHEVVDVEGLHEIHGSAGSTK